MNFKTNKVLKTFIQLLSERNFLTRHKWLCSDNTEFISYKYGPPGASLRNNLITNWREEIQFSKNYEPCFFVENYTLPILAKYCNSLSSNSASLSQQNGSPYSSEYVSRSLQMCACTLRQTNIKLPFTIAQIAVSYQSNNNEKIFLFDSSEKTNLTLIHFYSPNSTRRTFEILLQQRLQWWQQFANVSSNFNLVQTKNTQQTKNNRDESFLFSGIQYHFPWGWNTIEKTTILDATTYSLKELPNYTTTTENNAVDVKASVVVSNVTLEKGLLALLYDSYQERIRKLPKNVKTKKTVTAATKSTGVLKLHSSLSPYKVGVAIYGKKTRHLRQLAQRVIKDLKTLDIQILGSVDTASGLESQCIAYQQIGVLYIVLINDKSLETGLTRIINNDNKKEDQELVRVSDIKGHIYQNLKLATSHKT